MEELIETIGDLDERKILGYFETLRSAFIVKCAWLGGTSGENASGEKVLRAVAFPDDLLSQIEAIFADPPTYASIRGETPELFLNLQEDIMNSAVLSAWFVFEMVVKVLRNADFVTATTKTDINYTDRRFDFDNREKKDLDFFYYLRNAIAHANGAFTAVKAVHHWYDGEQFDSGGKEGQKMILKTTTSFRIINDLQKLTMKAWTNWKVGTTRHNKRIADRH
jgi:hypothetical protein